MKELNNDILSSEVLIKAFPVCFRNLRKEYNLTQLQVAELLDVSVTTICNWESGRRIPTFDKMFVFMQYCNLYEDIFRIYNLL